MKCETLGSATFSEPYQDMTVRVGVRNGLVTVLVAPLDEMGKYIDLTPLTALSVARKLICCAVKAPFK